MALRQDGVMNLTQPKIASSAQLTFSPFFHLHTHQVLTQVASVHFAPFLPRAVLSLFPSFFLSAPLIVFSVSAAIKR